MRIKKSNVNAPEVFQLFSEHDDFIIDFLGDDSIYYTRYNSNENLQSVWIAYCDEKPIGCVAYRVKDKGIGEVKRMYIKNEYRGRGISKLLLFTIEEYARLNGDHTLFLDTRSTLEPAVTIYRNLGFVKILCNGLYIQMEKKI